jgi:hypothetical protein
MYAMCMCSGRHVDICDIHVYTNVSFQKLRWWASNAVEGFSCDNFMHSCKHWCWCIQCVFVCRQTDVQHIVHLLLLVYMYVCMHTPWWGLLRIPKLPKYKHISRTRTYGGGKVSERLSMFKHSIHTYIHKKQAHIYHGRTRTFLYTSWGDAESEGFSMWTVRSVTENCAYMCMYICMHVRSYVLFTFYVCMEHALHFHLWHLWQPAASVCSRMHLQ